jgi:hypothetical protein
VSWVVASGIRPSGDFTVATIAVRLASPEPTGGSRT